MDSAQTIKVSIKWKKQVFDDIELNVSDDVMKFKAKVYELTKIPVDKQKIIAKGKTLKEGTEWSAYPGIVDGAQLTLMGTAEGEEL